MNPIFFPRIYFLSVWLLTFQILGAYDAPQFEKSLIDSDALFIKNRDKEVLVEALNAVAGNFSDSKLIDDDLREKSIALALQIDPLNINARNTHRALLNGKPPAKSAYFVESVSEVSERLWNMSDQLADGEPEAQKLALYLQELSLVLHPKPPLERIRQYGRETKGTGQDWKKVVSLQPKENPSNGKLEKLFTAARNTSSKPKTPRPPKPQPGPPSPPPPPIPTPVVGSSGAAKILLPKAQIPFVAHVQATIRGRRLGGLASLSITEATTADDGLFGVGPGRNAAMQNQMLLVSDPDGLQIAGLTRAELLVRRDFPVWPDKMLAEIRFESDLPMRSSPRLTKADTSLATSLLLHSVFSGKTILPNLMFAGEITGDPSGEKPVITIGKNLSDVLDQGKKIDGEFLLLPDNVFQQLVDGAVSSRRLDYLFAPQLISFSDWEQLKATAFGEGKEALAEASKAFLEIEAVQDKMSLVDLAKNDKVQERLNGIISKCPQHISARVMLAFGKTPDNPQAILREAVRKVDQSIEPFLKVVSELSDIEADPATLDYRDAETQLEEVDIALSKLGNTITSSAKPYLLRVEDFVDAAGKYFEVSNKSSSGGEQKRRDLNEAFKEVQSVRVSLGLDEINMQDYRDYGRRMKRRAMLRPL